MKKKIVANACKDTDHSSFAKGNIKWDNHLGSLAVSEKSKYIIIYCPVVSLLDIYVGEMEHLGLHKNVY